MTSSVHRSPRLVIAAVTALTLTLAACSPGVFDVHIDELADEAEAIGESLMAEIEDIERYQDDGINSGWSWDNPEAGSRDPSAKRNWGWSAHMELAQDALMTAEQAANVMKGVLKRADDDWTVTAPADNIWSPNTWEFRRSAEEGVGGWYVSITFQLDEPPAPQTMLVIVESPFTANRSASVRDQERRERNDAAATFEATATRVEALVAQQRAVMEDQAIRLRFMLGGGGNKKVYLDSRQRWYAAADELDGFITAVRRSIGPRDVGELNGQIRSVRPGDIDRSGDR